MSDNCTCLFGHEPGEICRGSSPIPEECSHDPLGSPLWAWKTTRRIPCKVCGKLTFSTSGRCLSHIGFSNIYSKFIIVPSNIKQHKGGNMLKSTGKEGKEDMNIIMFLHSDVLLVNDDVKGHRAEFNTNFRHSKTVKYTNDQSMLSIFDLRWDMISW
ncbi:1898_t:CDS:2, partial [Entrophospora sp. SA101]